MSELFCAGCRAPMEHGRGYYAYYYYDTDLQLIFHDAGCKYVYEENKIRFNQPLILTNLERPTPPPFKPNPKLISEQPSLFSQVWDRLTRILPRRKDKQ